MPRDKIQFIQYVVSFFLLTFSIFDENMKILWKKMLHQEAKTGRYCATY